MSMLESLEQLAELREVPEVEQEGLESMSLEPVLMEIPEVGEVLVSGEPYEIAKSLDCVQGDNDYNFSGTCGLVSVENLVRMSGREISEDDVVGRAIAMNLCSYSLDGNPENDGGTNGLTRQALLNTYRLPCTLFGDGMPQLSLEDVAQFAEAGHGVNISFNAGFAYDVASAVGDGTSNHSVIVTGTARDPETGKLVGMFLCDSGIGQGAVYMPIDRLAGAYYVPGASALITNEPIR